MLVPWAPRFGICPCILFDTRTASKLYQVPGMYQYDLILDYHRSCQVSIYLLLLCVARSFSMNTMARRRFRRLTVKVTQSSLFHQKSDYAYGESNSGQNLGRVLCYHYTTCVSLYDKNQIFVSLISYQVFTVYQLRFSFRERAHQKKKYDGGTGSPQTLAASVSRQTQLSVFFRMLPSPPSSRRVLVYVPGTLFYTKQRSQIEQLLDPHFIMYVFQGRLYS